MQRHKLMPRPSPQQLLITAAIAGLVGCAETPKYEVPATHVPPVFKEAEAFSKIFDPAKTSGAHQTTPVPDAWWELFRDPVLNSLQYRVFSRQANSGNQTLAASIAAISAARAALSNSHAALLPNVGVNAGVTRAGTNITNTGSSSYSTGVSLASWEVDLWNRLGSSVDAADARLLASEDDLASAELSIYATVAQTYIAMRAAEAQTAVVQRNIKLLERSLSLTQNRYKAGVVASVDVSQAQSQLKSAQAQVLDLRIQRAQLEHALAGLLGLAPSELSLNVTAKLPAVPQVPLKVPSKLLERRPDIAAAERRVNAANAQIGTAQAAFFPSLTLSANAGLKNSLLRDLISLPSLAWSLGPSLALSIFDGGARQAATDTARASYDQAVAQYRQTVLTALQEVEDNLIAASTLHDEEALQKDLLAAAQKTLTVTTNQYEAGIVSYLNVVNAQSTALAAETSLVNVQNRRLTALNTLLKNIAGRVVDPSKVQPVSAINVPAKSTLPAPQPSTEPEHWFYKAIRKGKEVLRLPPDGAIETNPNGAAKEGGS